MSEVATIWRASVAMDWRVRCGDGIAWSEWQSFGAQKVAMGLRALSGDHLACREC